MLVPKKVKKSQRPRFRGKGLLTEGYFGDINRINIPPQHAAARQLLKETLIPNPINNTIEVTGHFAVSSTSSNKGGYTKPYRVWTANIPSGYDFVAQSIFDKRLVQNLSTGRFSFLSYHFPRQDIPQKAEFHLPIPSQYVLGIHGASVERIPLEQLLPTLGKDIYYSSSIGRQTTKEFQEKLLMTPDEHLLFFSRDLLVSGYESSLNSSLLVSLNTVGGLIRSVWDTTITDPFYSESVGNRLLLTFGTTERQIINSTFSTSHDSVIPYDRLKWNSQAITGYPILQFYRYRYVITLKPEEEGTSMENIYEYIRRFYLLDTELSSEDWNYRVGDLVPDNASVGEFSRQVLENLIRRQPMSHEVLDFSDKPKLYTDNPADYMNYVIIRGYHFHTGSTSGKWSTLTLYPVNRAQGDRLYGADWNNILVNGQPVPIEKYLLNRLNETLTTKEERDNFINNFNTRDVYVEYDIDKSDTIGLRRWVNLSAGWMNEELSEEEIRKIAYLDYIIVSKQRVVDLDDEFLGSLGYALTLPQNIFVDSYKLLGNDQRIKFDEYSWSELKYPSGGSNVEIGHALYSSLIQDNLLKLDKSKITSATSPAQQERDIIRFLVQVYDFDFVDISVKLEGHYDEDRDTDEIRSFKTRIGRPMISYVIG